MGHPLRGTRPQSRETAKLAPSQLPVVVMRGAPGRRAGVPAPSKPSPRHGRAACVFPKNLVSPQQASPRLLPGVAALWWGKQQHLCCCPPADSIPAPCTWRPDRPALPQSMVFRQDDILEGEIFLILESVGLAYHMGECWQAASESCSEAVGGKTHSSASSSSPRLRSSCPSRTPAQSQPAVGERW